MVEGFKNKKTIIVGDVNTGKTAFLLESLKKFLGEGEKEIAVIDMAPETIRGIGGKMNREGLANVRYYTAEIAAPRLTGKTPEEAEMLAAQNARRIEEIFSEYMINPGKVLFMNDVSIYLQAGDLENLLTLIHATPTVVMNGYYGESLGGGSLGARERKNMKALRERCDRVITR